jgi:hypothetical protein
MPDPSAAWVLAPLIAGQPVYRLGRWIGQRFQYPRPTHPPKITKAIPRGPAAVMIHDVDGSVATLCLDLDTSKALQAVVESDAARLRTLLDEAGTVFVEDFSPSGGRHLYIPMQERLSHPEARELIEALGRVATSLDPSPHQNVTDGCIRVPGSIHKSGGHQTLITPLSQAYAVLRRRNTPDAIAALRSALAPELRRNKVEKERQVKAAASPRPRAAHLPLPGAGSETPLRRTARTGLYDAARYAGASEARLAVLNHLAACGWTLAQVTGELTGQFPGLAALYGTKQERLLPKEWAKAQVYAHARPAEKGSPAARQGKDAFINDTSPTQTTGGALKPSPAAIHQLVNDLENVLYAVLDERLKSRGREGLSLRLLIRGLLGYMRTKETTLVDVGCRTLAIAMGKHHSTIARLLPLLVRSSDGILAKVMDAHHKAADVYSIQLPEQYQQLARELTWRKGKIHAVRPVFRALGDPAALVYESIERGRHSPTSAEIIRATGLSRSGVDGALASMESLAMIHRAGRSWRIVASTNLTALAARLGVLDDYQSHISRYRRERAAWHAYLARWTMPIPTPMDLEEEERDEYWLPPPDAKVWVAA